MKRNNTTPPHDIFISYSSKDKKIAFALCHFLEKNGLHCWIAPRNIRVGKDYAESNNRSNIGIAYYVACI